MNDLLNQIGQEQLQGSCLPDGLNISVQLVSPELIPQIAEVHSRDIKIIPDVTIVNNPAEHQITEVLLDALLPINFRTKINLPATATLKPQNYLVAVVQEVLDKAEELNLGLCRYQGLIFGYTGTYWQGITVEDFVIFLGKAARKVGVPMYIADHYEFRDDLEKQFCTVAQLPTPKQNYNETLINLSNGTFVIPLDKEPYLRPYLASDFLTYKLPFCYDKEATAPLFRKYLDEVLPDTDSQKCIAEYLGYVFTRGNHMKLQKVLVLYGRGANGKSVLQEVITALYGEDNISNFDLEMLTGSNGYYRAVFANKLLNMCSEISTNLKAAIFKQLASGEPVSARQIREKPFTMRNYGKLIFNCNKLPVEVENTDGFFRRWLIAEFSNKFLEDRADINLHKKIIDKELSGVLNWVLAGLERLLSQKKFTQSALMKERVKMYQDETNSVALFIDDEHYQPDTTNAVPQLELFTQYMQYCRLTNRKALSNTNFGDRLEALGFSRKKRNIGQVVFIKRVQVELDD